MTSEAPTESTQSSEPRTTFSRQRIVVAVAVLAAAGIALFFALRRPPTSALPSPVAPLTVVQALPADAFLLGTLDVSRLRSFGLIPAEGPVPELNAVRDACGFDPLDKVAALGVAIPYDGDDFGLVATGSLDADAIVGCATKVISAQAGRPVTTTLGSFRTVRDGASSVSRGEVAVRPHGPALLGGGAMLRVLVDTADGTLPNAEKGSAHEQARGLLEGMDLAQVSVVLSAKQRKTIVDEAGDAEPALRKALASVTSAGVGARLSGDWIDLHAVVLTESEADAVILSDMLSRRVTGAAASPLVKILGASELLGRTRFEAKEKNAHVRLGAPISEVKTLVDRMIAFRQFSNGEGIARPRELPTPSASVSVPAPSSPAPTAPSPTAKPRVSNERE